MSLRKAVFQLSVVIGAIACVTATPGVRQCHARPSNGGTKCVTKTERTEINVGVVKHEKATHTTVCKPVSDRSTADRKPTNNTNGHARHGHRKPN